MTGPLRERYPSSRRWMTTNVQCCRAFPSEFEDDASADQPRLEWLNTGLVIIIKYQTYIKRELYNRLARTVRRLWVGRFSVHRAMFSLYFLILRRATKTLDNHRESILQRPNRQPHRRIQHLCKYTATDCSSIDVPFLRTDVLSPERLFKIFSVMGIALFSTQLSRRT